MTRTAKHPPSTITVHVPLKFAMRGGRKSIIGQVPQPNHVATRTRFDDAIITAIARAHRWRRSIEDGTYASITELASEKRVNQSYACRLLRLSLLAPDIVQAIIDRRGSDLTLDDLMRPLPAIWAEQSAML